MFTRISKQIIIWLCVVVGVAVFFHIQTAKAWQCQFDDNGAKRCIELPYDTPEIREQACRAICEDKALNALQALSGANAAPGSLTIPQPVVPPTCTETPQVVDKCTYTVPTVKLSNPIGSDQPTYIIGALIRKVIGVIGAVAFFVFFYGGVLWLTSAGNEDRVRTGSQAMLWATIGLFIIFSSYAILSVVLGVVAQ